MRKEDRGSSYLAATRVILNGRKFFPPHLLQWICFKMIFCEVDRILDLHLLQTKMFLCFRAVASGNLTIFIPRPYLPVLCFAA
jgi:hypothetical protein